jgi:putative oxidoreductase
MIDYSKYHDLSDLIFRVGLSLICIIGGAGHLVREQMMLQRIEASPWFDCVNTLGSPVFFLQLSGIVFILAGFGLLLGLRTRLSAFALFVTLVPITFVIHIAPEHTGPLFKNIAILGALLHFFVRGGGGFSVDRR